ncbi:DUF6636 domain-containing protein [Wielerella bovis]|uniref:DUF6636 domain-containing protein n=1 Tax=Wielerella bovis TaxID=2917790 RepID=UPI002018F534|nr:DUF6636 domain-containing protein [Wielerella bovis]ULJ59625.1 hypothetical protein MIS44_07980 [Wielerella bovis]
MKYSAFLLVLLTANAFAGSSSIDLTGNYHQVFTTPSGNILCGGDSFKRPQAKLYRNDVYCFVYKNKAMPSSCKQNPDGEIGMNFTLNQRGKAQMSCAHFEFAPDNVGESQTRTLKYGETIRGKGWACTSETTGLRCQNDAGRGFFLNRSRYELF